MNVAIVPRTKVFSGSDVTQGSQVARHDAAHSHGTGHLCIGMKLMRRRIAVDDFALSKHVHRVGRIAMRRLGHALLLLGRTWSLLASQVLLGKALFPGLCLPIVVTHTPTIHNHTGAELTKHGSCSDNCNLPRAVGVWKDALSDEVLLLVVRGDDLVEGAILVEEQVGVSVVQDAGAFGGEHEELVASVLDDKGATLVLALSVEMTARSDLSFAGIVDLSWYILVTLWIDLICGVISGCGQGFDILASCHCLWRG